MKSIRPVQKVIDAFEALPGIGPKSAARLAYYLLHVPQEKMDKFAKALENLKETLKSVQFVLILVKMIYVLFVKMGREINR